MRARFENNIYRDCKWCAGKGCLACPGEAEKAYKKAFPDGPKPIAVISYDDPEFSNKLNQVIVDHVGSVKQETSVDRLIKILDDQKKESVISIGGFYVEDETL